MRGISTLLMALMLGLPLTAPGAEVPADDRMAAYREFRAAFDAGHHNDALAPARRVVELTAQQFGEDSPELANPLVNLATTHYRLGQNEAALDEYQRALRLLDQLGNAADPRLVAPLHGLGAALRALGRDEDAVVPLKRALDITRSRDGLHAPAQLPVLRALITSYVTIGRLDDAGREEQYAYNVAESTYGRNDIRMLGPLDSLARWNELTGRYTAARALHMRAVEVADAARPQNPLAVDALRGIARSFRQAFIHGEAEQAAAASMEMPTTLASQMLNRAATVPSGEGERALREALQRLQGGDNAALRGAVLVDLGDWYLTAGTVPRALGTYREAWRELAIARDTTALDQPAMVVYRPPSVSTYRRQENPDEYIVQPVQLRVSIGTDGSVRGTTVANPAPEREAAERAVASAVRRAVWRPAFRDGDAAAVGDHLFVEQVYLRRPKENN